MSHPLKKVVYLEGDAYFYMAFRECAEDIPNATNSWLCYDFRERRIIPTHDVIRSNAQVPSHPHLRAWVVEMSPDMDI
jgi:hypothetical protein